MVERTYEDTKNRVLCGPGIPGEFKVNVGALSPLLCMAVVELISRTIGTKDIIRKNIIGRWPGNSSSWGSRSPSTADRVERCISRHGLRLSLEKAEVIGQRRKELEIHLDGKKLKQGDGFVYLGGAVYGDSNSDTKICRRITAGTNAWRKVEGMMRDSWILRKRKGKVLCYPGIHIRLRNDGTSRETTGESTGLSKLLDKKHCGSEENG